MKLLGLTIAFVAICGVAGASEWSGFYTAANNDMSAARPPRADDHVGDRDPGACIRAILAAQERYEIPDNILLGIGLQEAGTKRDGNLTVWPWAVNAAGEGRLFKDQRGAVSWVRERLSAGVRSIDVGCMQINLRWHPDAFSSVEQGFDPGVNADYAARFLRDLYRKTGNWVLAAGSYHSFTPAKRDRYLKSLRRNVSVANKQIDALRARAGQLRAKPSEDTIVASRDVADGSNLWSASLSASTSTLRRSLYGNAELKPILPNFRQVP